MIHLNFQGDAHEVHKDIKGLFSVRLFDVPTPETTPVPIETPAKATKKESKKETAPTQADAKAAEEKFNETKPATTQTASPASGTVFEQIQLIIPDLVKKIRRDGTLQLLAKYDGATNAKTIPEARHAEFLKEAQGLLA